MIIAGAVVALIGISMVSYGTYEVNKEAKSHRNRLGEYIERLEQIDIDRGNEIKLLLDDKLLRDSEPLIKEYKKLTGHKYHKVIDDRYGRYGRYGNSKDYGYFNIYFGNKPIKYEHTNGMSGYNHQAVVSVNNLSIELSKLKKAKELLKPCKEK